MTCGMRVFRVCPSTCGMRCCCCCCCFAVPGCVHILAALTFSLPGKRPAYWVLVAALDHAVRAVLLPTCLTSYLPTCLSLPTCLPAHCLPALQPASPGAWQGMAHDAPVKQCSSCSPTNKP